MRRFAAFATLVLSVALVAPLSLTTVAALAQTSPQPAPEFRTGTAVVLLDVIARDKKGRPVRDLKAEELQVFENDQRCEIRSFRLVESESTIEPGAAGAVPAPIAPVEPPRGRRSARRGPARAVQPRHARLRPDEPRGQPPRREGRARLRREGHGRPHAGRGVHDRHGARPRAVVHEREGAPARGDRRGHLGEGPEGPLAHRPGAAGLARRDARRGDADPARGAVGRGRRLAAGDPGGRALEPPRAAPRTGSSRWRRCGWRWWPTRCAWPTACSARRRATGRCIRCWRWSRHRRALPAARPSSSSPRACRSRRTCRTSSGRSSARPTARTSASTAWTRAACSRARTSPARARLCARRRRPR